MVERKHATLPRYLVVLEAQVAAWQLTQTTMVEARLNGQPLGRRALKRWDARRWFLELPHRTCEQWSLGVGDRVVLELALASTTLPDELADLLATEPAAQSAWAALSASRQRMLCEEVRAAARTATRVRRARCGLGLGAE
ncbi:MAG: YdeI/OmpD-associated family protein [Gemmatimonadetes bacterium]|nr:YdeI/OmpD-associated family protein [Gemmatimonadota bacterium]